MPQANARTASINRLLPCLTALLVSAMPLAAQESDAAPTEPTPTAMLVLWGNPEYTVGDCCWQLWPDWSVSAFKLGGSWDFEAPCWMSTPGEVNALCLELDREALKTDLAMVLWFGGNPAIVDLYDAQGGIVAHDLPGMPMESVADMSCRVYPLNLLENPGAVGVLIGSAGNIEVQATFLFECPDSSALLKSGDSGLNAEALAILPASASLADTAAATPGVAAVASPEQVGASNHAGSSALNGSAVRNQTQNRLTYAGLIIRSPASGSRILW